MGGPPAAVATKWAEDPVGSYGKQGHDDIAVLCFLILGVWGVTDDPANFAAHLLTFGRGRKGIKSY